MNNIVMLLLAVLLCGCSRNERTVSLTNVTAATSVLLQNPSQSGRPTELSLRVYGSVHGTADVFYVLGTPYIMTNLSGVFDFRWRADWYDNMAEIKYVPKGVTGGVLNITYEFDPAW